MEMLDLSRHSPNEFEGKGVSINGCDYVVGKIFRDGDQGHAHALQNQRSGLSLHFVQIRRNYLSDPARARLASDSKVEMNRVIRTGMMKDGGPVVVAPLRTVRNQDTVLELHEFPADSNRRIPDLALEVIGAGRFEEALLALDPFLATDPQHTQALSLRARLNCQLNRLRPSLDDIEAACEIEPNLSGYRLELIEYNFRAGQLSAAGQHLARFKREFPEEHDADIWEVNLLLRQGLVDLASRFAGDAALPAEQLKQLEAAVARRRAGGEPFNEKSQREPRSWWSRLVGR